MSNGISLRSLGVALMLCAFGAGLLATWLWYSSVQSWQRHQTQSYVAGFSLYQTLIEGRMPPPGVILNPLDAITAEIAERSGVSQLPDLPRPSFVTNVSIHDTSWDQLSSQTLNVAIVSGSLRYTVSDITSEEGQSGAQQLGNITRLLATFCSEPILYAQIKGGIWLRIDGTEIWGCSVAPRDFRLGAVVLAIAALVILFTLVAEGTARFERFALALRSRRRLGGPERYSTEGPSELREIVNSVNSYLESERDQLSKRVVVLSGVSHDLGTPATRLRLRAALIPEQDLRAKFEADIDSMTAMIESVLTYTQSELNVEDPRRLSLMSLVESVVDDYRDTGKPVSFVPAVSRIAEGGRSLFSAQPGHGSLPELQRILVVARPIALKRALSNLIDNALKYGRSASVVLDANADFAVITVEDEGSGMSVDDINAVCAPFKRGDNIGTISGFGLGLTIVSTVAEQHGGSLTFEAGQRGLRARMEICRN